MASAEPLALGELGLTPAEFGRLTVREFTVMLAGHRRRERRLTHLLAFLLARCLSPWLKEPMSAEQLLGWPSNWWVSDGRD